MSISDNDALTLLLQLAPPGLDKWIDTSATATSGKAVRAIAQALKLYGFDVLDTLRSELGALTMSARVPDWETILGVAGDAVASYGNTARRRTRVLARRRESGGSVIPAVRSIVGPLLGYADPNQLVVLEVDRATLTAANQYNAGTMVVAASGTSTNTIRVLDDGKVSPAGFRLSLQVTCTDLTQLRAVVVAPGGDTYAFFAGTFGTGNVTNQTVYLYGRAASVNILNGGANGAAGNAIFGNWTLLIADVGAVGFSLLAGSALVVEGVGHDALGYDGLGAEIFHWGVLVDHTLEGVSVAQDYDSARAAIARLNPGHDNGALIFCAALDNGTTAIPDDAWALPDACIPA